MYSKCWQIIKDDANKTFEICGQTTNSNLFTNSVYGMQKAGMSVSCITPPVTIINSSKEIVKIPGYTKEDGLQKRLQAEYRKLMMDSFDDDDL